MQRRLFFTNHQVVAVMLVTQSVGYDVCLAGVVVNVQVVVLDQLQPPSLSQVQLRLGEDILQALVIGINVALVSHQIVPPYLEGVNDRG
jgi:hypothetical protein